MGYPHVDPAAVPATPNRSSVQLALVDAAGLTEVAVDRYRVEPGDRAPLANHDHDEPEAEP